MGRADWPESLGCLSKNFIRKLEDGRELAFEANGARRRDTYIPLSRLGKKRMTNGKRK